jgi:hypothetical protein
MLNIYVYRRVNVTQQSQNERLYYFLSNKLRGCQGIHSEMINPDQILKYVHIGKRFHRETYICSKDPLYNAHTWRDLSTIIF